MSFATEIRRVGDCSGSSSILVFDIGGTTIRAGHYDPARDAIVERLDVPADETRQRGPPPRALASCLSDLATRLDRGLKPDAVAVAFPGPVTKEGFVLAAPTLWPSTPIRPFSLAQQIRAVWPDSEVAVLNDITAAGYAYASPSQPTFCVVTVSSGVGHKVFWNGEPLLGPAARGGEIGHVVIDPSPNAAVCDCGGRGHLGAVASGRGMLAAAKSQAIADSKAFATSMPGQQCRGDVESLTSEVLAQGFREGDEWSAAVIRSGAEPLGWMVAFAHAMLGLESFIVIGGFARALGRGFCREIAAAAAENAWSLGEDWAAMIELGSLGNDAGLLGCGRVAARKLTVQGGCSHAY
jgi:glucokinase